MGKYCHQGCHSLIISTTNLVLVEVLFLKQAVVCYQNSGQSTDEMQTKLGENIYSYTFWKLLHFEKIKITFILWTALCAVSMDIVWFKRYTFSFYFSNVWLIWYQDICLLSIYLSFYLSNYESFFFLKIMLISGNNVTRLFS